MDDEATAGAMRESGGAGRPDARGAQGAPEARADVGGHGPGAPGGAEAGSAAGLAPAPTFASGSGSGAGSGHGAVGWGTAPMAVAPTPRGVGRRLLTPLGALAGVVAAFGYVGSVDPNEPGHYPVCPLLRFTGVYCPGCGGLRSAHAFAHGDLAAALGFNALAVVGYLVFAVVMVVWLVRAVRGLPLRIVISPAWWWGIGGVLALFTLVRNLPFGSVLAP
ncbi:DUF2752 domain-containing protein [Streptomyces sp. NPDC053431]|uniref:DUF2752 domain-containing protein n=1 Tax=Streptomyces sp. NPDC053431 TaxID=3365703 RepID=UPI0037D2A0FE